MKKKYYYIIAIIIIIITAIIGIIYFNVDKEAKSPINPEDIVYDIYYNDGVDGSTRTYEIEIGKNEDVFVKETMMGSVVNAKPEISTKQLKISDDNLQKLENIINETEPNKNEEQKDPMAFYIIDRIENKTYKYTYGKKYYDDLGEVLHSIGAIGYYAGSMK